MFARKLGSRCSEILEMTFFPNQITVYSLDIDKYLMHTKEEQRITKKHR